MKQLTYLLLAILSITFFACGDGSTATTTTGDEKVLDQKVYTIGIVPQFSAKRILSIWSPILEELEAKTGHKFQIVGAPNIPAFEAAYEEGAYDIAYMNPYHSVVANTTQGYQAVLRDGTKSLFGVLAVRKDDPIKDVKELDGEILSFPAPNALGASLLMRTELKTIHHIDITPSYVNTHTNSYLSVVEGKSRAGGGVMRTFNELSDDIKDKLKIFYSTQKTPPHPIVIHPRVNKVVQDEIVNAFLEMGKDDSTNAYLQKIPIKEIVKTSQAEYKILEDLGMESFYVKPKETE